MDHAASQTSVSAESATPQKPSSPLLSPVVWCILITETGERFCFYGFRSCLVLYFTMALEMEEHQAIAWFAYTTAFAYLTPIGGALLADGHLGRYTAILVFGLIYVIGMVILTAAAIVQHHVSAERIWAMAGLFLICVGTGGVKPCVSAFGADQVGASSNDHHRKNKNTADPHNNNSHSEHLLDHHDHHHHHAEPPVDPREALCETLQPTEGEEREEQVRSFFNYFYFCINVGAVTSVAVIPLLRSHFGFGAAFLVPTIFMVIAMALFISMRNRYIHHVPGKYGSNIVKTFRLCAWLWYHQLWAKLPERMSSLPWLQPRANMLVTSTPSQQPQGDGTIPIVQNAAYSSSATSTSNPQQQQQQQLEEAAQALRVLPIMSLLPIFWCLYDQQGSVWTLQASRMNLGGFKPEQLSIFNPIEIMILIPLFEGYFYPWLTKRNCRFSPMRRMQWGMLLTAMSFFVSGLVESEIQGREEADETQVHVLWQLPQITLLSIGEIFVSVTGLEFAYSESPESLRSFWMAVFLLTTAIGDLFSGVLYSTVFSQMNRAVVMYICAVLMLLNLGLFAIVARRWEQYARKRSSSDS